MQELSDEYGTIYGNMKYTESTPALKKDTPAPK
jgi:hypothetical protein